MPYVNNLHPDGMPSKTASHPDQNCLTLVGKPPKTKRDLKYIKREANELLNTAEHLTDSVLKR